MGMIPVCNLLLTQSENFLPVCGCGFEYPSRQYVNPSSHKRRGNKLKTRPGQRTPLSACPFGTGRGDFFARGHLIMVTAPMPIFPTGACLKMGWHVK